MKAVNEAMDDTTDWITSILTFMTNLVAPEEEEDEGINLLWPFFHNSSMITQQSVYSNIHNISETTD